VDGAPIGGILLAAGESRRMGFPKPLLKIDGETFLAHAASAMLSAVESLVVVLGAHAVLIRGAVPRDARIAIVENPDFARGQLSSLKIGLRALAPRCAAAMVHLADHPMVAQATFRAVAREYARSHGKIIVARHAGHRGHPVLFDRTIFSELMRAPEEQGARAVLNADPARVTYVDIDDPGVTLDLDTPDDLRRAGLAPPPPER
jgi:molybdenum cofactor cytidylyltransferase